MKVVACERDEELLDALSRGFVPVELGAHADSCRACGELRVVAGALLDDRARTMIEAPVPSAGTMWWRMQVRQRHEAQAMARRSLLIGQAVTLAVALFLIASLFGAELAVEVREVITAVRLSTPLMIAVATWLLLAPIAGYVAIRQK